MNKTSTKTFFTRPSEGTREIYAAPGWMRIEFQLETAGPVVVGTSEDLLPVLSGKGILLPPDGEPIRFPLSKGERVFIACEAINRVKIISEPIPWQEQIALSINASIQQMAKLFGGRK